MQLFNIYIIPLTWKAGALLLHSPNLGIFTRLKKKKKPVPSAVLSSARLLPAAFECIFHFHAHKYLISKSEIT